MTIKEFTEALVRGEVEIPPDGVRLKPRTYVTGLGQVLKRTHSRKECIGEHCVIHGPSDHSMRDFPTLWRTDRGFMERVCEHGVGHPDPDDPFADPVHGCDGCCHPGFLIPQENETHRWYKKIFGWIGPASGPYE